MSQQNHDDDQDPEPYQPPGCLLIVVLFLAFLCIAALSILASKLLPFLFAP